MTEATTHTNPHATPRPATLDFSRAALVLAWLLLAATFLLISPPTGKTYPGAIPWHDLSILRRVTDLMALGGAVSTARGVEIKDLAFHLAAIVGWVLVGLRMLWCGVGRGSLRAGPAQYAQLLMAGWVVVSLLSSLWAGDADLARGQALLYALNLGWAIALAATLERRHVHLLLYGLVASATLGAVLCIWYFYERNPFHAPGFPIGNPIPLAAAMLPALLIAAIRVGEAAWESARQRRPCWDWPTVGALVALLPLSGCLALTHARGALVALTIALAVVVICLVPRRQRWVVAVVLAAGLLAGGLWWFSRSQLDVTMARGATLRFRLYAWRYAAELWQGRPILGHGAGAYPRLAGELAVRDRTLDPAAFMAELVEHAHNEFFEVFAEIGLVGGVTLVAGLLATFVAATRLWRAGGPSGSRWIGLSLLSALTALVADALTGPALRLPGVGPIFYTLVGGIWAASATGRPPPPAPTRGRRSPASAVAAILALAAAAGSAWLTIRNWGGVLHEQAATSALERGLQAETNRAYATAEPLYAESVESFAFATQLLLDPVRVVGDQQHALDAAARRAALAVRGWSSAAASEARGAAWPAAARLAEETYVEAGRLGASIPSLTHTDATVARAAEWLYMLHQGAGSPAAAEWATRAERGWSRQRQRTPYDVETLLALTRYPAPIEFHVGLLRDALRFGQVQGVWLECLKGLGQQPKLADVLARFVAAAGPFTPQTDLDALVASMAPETYRLQAAWRAWDGDFAGAAEDAARAARLYAPLSPRFPTLYSTALAEQAAYVLRGSATQAPRAVALLEQALAALPSIQAQKYEDLARPFRSRLAVALLAAGQVQEALRVAQQALGERAAEPQVLEQWLQAVVREAATLDLAPDRLGDIRRELCPFFPSFCAATTAPG